MMLNSIEVLNPVAMMPPPSRNLPPASRPARLDGKRVGLYWNLKAGGNFALERVGEMLKDRYKVASVKMYSSPRPIEQKVFDTMKSECDVVVGTSAD